jgi:hypothetical protein
MTDPAVRACRSSTEHGLSPYDRDEVMAATRLLPGRWSAKFEERLDGKSCACLRRTESDASTAAYRLERHDGFVILTDRVSDQPQNLVTRHRSMTKAMRRVFAIVLANGAVLYPGSRPSLGTRDAFVAVNRHD